ncbi:MAG: radical SAM protein [Chloroflexia bacterium]|nr:radical SAM protein [Chloroflexia bacterium]
MQLATLPSNLAPPPAGPLAAPGAVLLVSCYELGRQPLSLATPLACLRQAGFAPAAVDTAVEPLTDEAIRPAKFVAIMVPMHTALRLGTAVARRVRACNPAAHISFCGLYATLNADHLLRDGLGDSVIGGEVDGPLTALVTALNKGMDAVTVDGVGTRALAAPAVLDPAPPSLRLLPPDRRGLPSLRRYAGLERAGEVWLAGAVEATRGCRHTCRHCPIPPVYGGKFVVVPRPVVVADALAQIAAGARHLTFGDPDFFNGPSHGLRIMRELRADAPDLTFDVTIKVEHVIEHQRRLPELVELGCIFIVSAVESLSDQVLTKLDKGHTRADIETALRLLDAVDLPMRPSLLPFTPWTTLEDYRELLRFVARQDLFDHVDPVHFSIRLLVPPGSSLLADPTSADWLQALDAANFTYRWRSPDERLDRLQREVASIVTAGSMGNTPARETFGRIWEAAHAISGLPLPPLPEPVAYRRRPPRLTEDWFC